MNSATSCGTFRVHTRCCGMPGIQQWHAVYRNTTLCVPVCDASRWLFQRQVTDACQNQLVSDVPGSYGASGRKSVERPDLPVLVVFRIQWTRCARNQAHCWLMYWGVFTCCRPIRPVSPSPDKWPAQHHSAQNKFRAWIPNACIMHAFSTTMLHRQPLIIRRS